MKKFCLIWIFLISLAGAKDIYSKPFVQTGLGEYIDDFKTTKNYVVTHNFIIDKKSGRLLKVFKDFKNIIKINDTLAVINTDKGVIFLDLTTNQIIKTIKGEFDKVVLDKNNLIYTPFKELNKVIVYDLKKSKKIKIFKSLSKNYEVENISKDYIVYRNVEKKNIKIRDIHTNKIRTIKNRDYLFSNNEYIIIGKESQNSYKIELKDIKTNELYKTFKTKGSYAIDIYRNILIFQESNKVNFWDIKNKKFVYQPISLKEDEYFVGIDKNLLYLSYYNDIYKYPFSSKKREKWFFAPKSAIKAIGFNGKYIAAISENGEDIYVFNAKNGKLYRKLKTSQNLEDTNFIKIKGDYLLISNLSNYQIFNLKTKKLIKTISKPGNVIKKNDVVAVDISQDELAIAYNNKKIEIRSFKNNKLIDKYSLKKYFKKFDIDSIMFNENYIVLKLSNLEKSKIALLNRKNKKIITLPKKFSFAYPLEKKDNTLILEYADKDKKTKRFITRIIKWDIKKRKIKEELAHSKFADAEAIIRDVGRDYVIYEIEDGAIELYDRKTNKFIRNLSLSADFFIVKQDKLAYFKYGKPAIYLYDIKKDKNILTSYILDNKNWLSITPEGYYVGTKGAKKYLNITKFTKDGMKIATNPQIYNFYNRPDLVELKLSGDEKAYKKAIKKLEQKGGLNKKINSYNNNIKL